VSRFTDHAAALCRRAPNAKSIRVGAITVTGPVTEEDRVVADASGSETLRRFTVATVPTAAFEADPLTRHTTATVGATLYTIRDVRLLDDGELTEVLMARTSL